MRIGQSGTIFEFDLEGIKAWVNFLGNSDSTFGSCNHDKICVHVSDFAWSVQND